MKQLLTLLTISLLAFGCSNSTDPGTGTGGTTPFKHTIPGVGSTFEYLYVLPDTTFVAVAEVIADGLEIRGKKNVIRVELELFHQKNSTFLSYENDGDISSMYADDSVWYRQPIESKKQFVHTSRDTNGSITTVYEYTGTPYKQNDLIVNGTTVKGYQIEEQTKRTIYDADGKVIDVENFDKSYTTWSHDIGMWTQMTFGPISRTLQKYTLK